MAAALPRNRRRQEEGESVFVSMTDLTVSFLFVILILLAFFATQYKPEETVSRDEYDTLILELSKARDAIRRLGKELSAAQEYIEELEQEHRQSEARLAERGRVITELRMEISALRERVALLRASETALREELEAITRDRTLEGSFEEVRAERDAAHERAEALEVEVRRLNVAVAELESEIARLLERIAELRTPDPLATYLESAASARADLLKRLAERIQERLPGIRVTVVAADGVIRFRGDDLFASGQWRVRDGSTAERVAHAVADALADTLPCYTVGSRAAFYTTCNSAYAVIETIQIEGHTDDTPLSIGLQERERMLDNRDLSARRGAETLRAATDRYRPELMDFLNLEGQPVLSFAGYGAMRPVARGDTPAAKAANRRIDIRFILQTPQNLREVEEIRTRLVDNRPNLPTIEEMRPQ